MSMKPSAGISACFDRLLRWLETFGRCDLPSSCLHVRDAAAFLHARYAPFVGELAIVIAGHSSPRWCARVSASPVVPTVTARSSQKRLSKSMSCLHMTKSSAALTACVTTSIRRCVCDPPFAMVLTGREAAAS